MGTYIILYFILANKISYMWSKKIDWKWFKDPGIQEKAC